MLASVARDRALMGLKVRFPHSFRGACHERSANHISRRRDVTGQSLLVLIEIYHRRDAVEALECIADAHRRSCEMDGDCQATLPSSYQRSFGLPGACALVGPVRRT